ncbi:MAG: hypothetical protein ACFFF9_13220, partial [Candidatus Thorarchaeota archaeon]
LIVFRWFAVRSYQRNRGVTTPSDYSWLTRMGKKIADSESLKFSIIYVVVLCLVFLITLSYSYDMWKLYSLPSFGWLPRPFVSTLLALPVLLLILCAGVLFVTMTSRGLSWWDTRVISFRFYGSRRRVPYMKDEIQSLIEENSAGMETYRAYLTIERLFKHEFLAGEVARGIIKNADPELHQELESSLMERGAPQKVSRLVLTGSIILLVLSIWFLFLESFIDTPLARSSVLADAFFTLFIVFFLMWMVVLSLELPKLTPTEYMKLKETPE